VPNPVFNAEVCDQIPNIRTGSSTDRSRILISRLQPQRPLAKPRARLRAVCYHFKDVAENIIPARRSATSKIVRYWVPVALMILAMYFFSTDLFSIENTRGIVATILSWFVEEPSKRAIAEGNVILRKSAHFVEYGVLATLVIRAFRADSALFWRHAWGVYSFLIVVSWAAIDEFHQSRTRKRGGSMRDVLLDSAGGLFAIAAFWAISRVMARRGTREDH
jgi:VanZ family protein